MKELDNLLLNKKRYFRNKIIHTTVKDRIVKIKAIRNWILDNEDFIIKSCLKDYKKPIAEFYTTELKPVLNHIRFTLKNIKKWTARKSVWTPFHLIGTSSKVYYEPKGVCLIISPWNYPFNLTLNPVISAIAAGNCVIVKPSEHTPHTSSLVANMLASIFDLNELQVIEGGVDVGEYLIGLNFDHIFFTGSPDIGKIVMRSAAKNLSSVTLELGGKNHAIVDQTANIKDAVEKILWSKYVNCGQTCIAVNHVFVHKKCYQKFLSIVPEVLANFFSNNSSFGTIVNAKHLNRLRSLLKEALDCGGKLLTDSNKISQGKSEFPITILQDVSRNNPILKHEIFGPILPVLPYDDFDDVLDFIRSGEKPLALYLFSKSYKNYRKFIHLTSSGTVAINDCMLQYANPHLPFGGVNTSGIGKTGGKSGFLAFSNEKSVLFQKSGFSVAKFIYPPYSSIKQRLAKILG